MTEWNRQTIIAKTAELGGGRSEQLLAMNREDDPFYFTDSQKAVGRWFQRIIEEHFSHLETVYLRRIHYAIQNNDELKVRLPDISETAKKKKKKDLAEHWGKRYDNLSTHYDVLSQGSKVARIFGWVDWERIVDAKSRDIEENAIYRFSRDLFFIPSNNVDVDISCWLRFSDYDLKNVQYYHVEVIVEKATINDIVLPLCRKYGTNAMIGTGNMSLTRIFELAKRSNWCKRPVRIFYISDHDSAGQSMCLNLSRHLQRFIYDEHLLNTDIKLQPIALTRAQVEEHNLPKSPDDAESTELDSLIAYKPGELDRILEGWLSTFIDLKKEGKAEDLIDNWKSAQRRKVVPIEEQYEDEIQALSNRAWELAEEIKERVEKETFDNPPELPGAEQIPHDNEIDWLFDGRRDYLEQNKHYQAFKALRPKRMFKCKKCGKGFTSTKTLKEHQREQHG